MPLPEKNAPWPPVSPVIASDLEDWSAWYAASPDRLTYRYRNRRRTGRRYGQPENRPSQYRGGIVGTLSRWFWGEPSALGEKRANLHMPLARDLARTSADLLFSEPPTLVTENRATMKRLEDMLHKEGLLRTLIAQAEMTAALGGGYLRAMWDLKMSPRPWATVVRADGAAPRFFGDRLREVTFWKVLAVDGQKVVRHLEHHEPDTILHAVYEGTEDNLGTPVDLNAYPDTRGLQAAINLPMLKGRLACVYVPNTMTAPDWHDVPGSAGLGTSDYQGAETFLSAIDEAYTSWMRDVRLAKSRIIVPAGYLQSNGIGEGVSWQDREVFAPMNIPPTEQGQGITLNQFAIRHAEHRATIEDLVSRCIRNAGYSGGTFGDDDGGGLRTATEVRADTARSMATRGRKSELESVSLSEFVETLLILENSYLFPNAGSVEVERPEVRFADSIQDDVKVLAESADLLRRAEAASTEALVALVNPGMPLEQQQTEVARIKAESGRDTADPTETGAE
ncbi:phage portal protein [Streptomyces sp. MSC1_001]|jgi:A118 family predicted phage portal protein|uniref:capsid protein n=1 Tax=Streptomyces sp. MSC1_001 TaxID=2909263 RepID=UPI00203087AB|nr:capsid protein [Streptomyces sp. MSC1_001]